MSSDQQLSQQIEDILVARNPRGMSQIKMALTPGYCLRAAQILRTCIQQDLSATILIGTGFPVVGTFETDGPVGAIMARDLAQLAQLRPGDAVTFEAVDLYQAQTINTLAQLKFEATKLLHLKE